MRDSSRARSQPPGRSQVGQAVSRGWCRGSDGSKFASRAVAPSNQLGAYRACGEAAARAVDRRAGRAGHRAEPGHGQPHPAAARTQGVDKLTLRAPGSWCTVPASNPQSGGDGWRCKCDWARGRSKNLMCVLGGIPCGQGFCFTLLFLRWFRFLPLP